MKKTNSLKTIICTLVIAISLLSGAISVHASDESPFSDMTRSDWFYNTVMGMTSSGIIKGFPDGTFRPDTNLTNGQFATLISRFFLKSEPATEISAIISLVNAGFINSNEIDLVNFSDVKTPVSREKAVAVLMRAKNIKFVPFCFLEIETYSDLDSISLEYRDAVMTADYMGYVNGDNNNRFNPKTGLTRAEFTAIMSRSISDTRSEVPLPAIMNGLRVEYDDTTSSDVFGAVSAMNKIPSKVLNAFTEDEWNICFTKNSIGYYVNGDSTSYLNAVGLEDPESKLIVVQINNVSANYKTSPDTIIHEIGHYLYDRTKNYSSSASAQLLSSGSESEGMERLTKDSYFTTNKFEYFAEAFLCYCKCGYDGFRLYAPQSADMIHSAIEML